MDLFHLWNQLFFMNIKMNKANVLILALQNAIYVNINFSLPAGEATAAYAARLIQIDFDNHSEDDINLSSLS